MRINVDSFLFCVLTFASYWLIWPRSTLFLAPESDVLVALGEDLSKEKQAILNSLIPYCIQDITQKYSDSMFGPVWPYCTIFHAHHLPLNLTMPISNQVLVTSRSYLKDSRRDTGNKSNRCLKKDSFRQSIQCFYFDSLSVRLSNNQPLLRTVFSDFCWLTVWINQRSSIFLSAFLATG